MQQPGAHVAVELSTFGRAESGASMVEGRATRTTANGAGRGIDRKGGDRGQKEPPGMRSTRRKRLFLGAVFLRMPKGLAKIGEIGEAPGRQTCRASPVITG